MQQVVHELASCGKWRHWYKHVHRTDFRTLRYQQSWFKPICSGSFRSTLSNRRREWAFLHIGCHGTQLRTFTDTIRFKFCVLENTRPFITYNKDAVNSDDSGKPTNAPLVPGDKNHCQEATPRLLWYRGVVSWTANSNLSHCKPRD